jgi:hypothetical protein
MNRKKQLWLAAFSCAMSLWLNLCMFLVAMAFGGKSPEPLVAEIADTLMTPSGAIAAWLLGPGYRGHTIVQGLGSLVFYTVLFWCVATAFSLVGPRRRRDT